MFWCSWLESQDLTISRMTQAISSGDSWSSGSGSGKSEIRVIPTIQMVAKVSRRSYSLTRLLALFGIEALTALGALDLLRVDAADLVRRNRAPALRADSVEGRLHFFEIDFLLLGHSRFSHAGRKGNQ